MAERKESEGVKLSSLLPPAYSGRLGWWFSKRCLLELGLGQ